MAAAAKLALIPHCSLSYLGFKPWLYWSFHSFNAFNLDLRLLLMGKVERMSFEHFSRSQNFKRVIFKRPAFNIFVLRKTNSRLTEGVIFQTSFWQLDRFWNKSRQSLPRSKLFDPDDWPASCRHSLVGSTSVEHLPSDPVVKGSNPVRCFPSSSWCRASSVVVAQR